MNLFDRDRLIIAVVVSVIVHGAIFAGISLADFNTQVPEFSGPVYVDLPPVTDTPVPPEEEQEQAPEEEPPSDTPSTEQQDEPQADPRDEASVSPPSPPEDAQSRQSASEAEVEPAPQPRPQSEPAPTQPAEPQAPSTTAAPDRSGESEGAGSNTAARVSPPERESPELPEWVTNPDAAEEQRRTSSSVEQERDSSDLPPVEERESSGNAQDSVDQRPRDSSRTAQEGADPLSERRDEQVEVSREDVLGREQREAEPGSDEELPASEQGWLSRETGDTRTPASELPDWARRTMDRSGISTDEMTAQDATQLAEKLEADPALERRLESVIAAVSESQSSSASSPASSESAPGRDGDAAGDGRATRDEEESVAPGGDTESTSDEGPGETDTSPSSPASSGDSALEFLGSGTGGLRPVNPFPKDILSPEDFPGVVPAETTFVIIFEIAPSGVVVPGSVIFQQQSPYTSVNEKIRRAVLNWGFTPHGGNEPVTAIFTPLVRREAVRR